jgi:lysozyme
MGEKMTPKSKPQLNIVEIQKILEANKIDRKKYPVCLINVRGYYLNSMGEKGKNDRGIYDDAFFWISTNGMMSFNGNSDPSRYRKGKGKGAEKGMAELICGVWLYQTGVHNGSSPHPAFRQAERVTVKRDGLEQDYLDTGWFGINIHRGGVNGTSSLGCQTVPTAQWPAFKELGYSELKRNGQKVFPYILIAETERRKGNYVAGGVL